MLNYNGGAMYYERAGQSISSTEIPIRILSKLDRVCYVYLIDKNKVKCREGSRYQRDFDFVEKNNVQWRKLVDNKFTFNGTRWEL